MNANAANASVKIPLAILIPPPRQAQRNRSPGSCGLRSWCRALRTAAPGQETQKAKRAHQPCHPWQLDSLAPHLSPPTDQAAAIGAGQVPAGMTVGGVGSRRRLPLPAVVPGGTLGPRRPGTARRMLYGPSICQHTLPYRRRWSAQRTLPAIRQCQPQIVQDSQDFQD